MKRIVWLMLLSFVSMTSFTFADEVVFNNGEKLIGEVVSLADGVLVFNSNIAGKVTVDMTMVQTFHTDKSIKIHFKDGTVIDSVVKADNQGGLSIAGNAIVKPQPLKLSTLDKINPVAVPPVVWSGSVKLSVSSAHGNTYKESGAIGFDTTRITKDTRWHSNALFLLSRDEDALGEKKTSEENFTLSSKYDRFYTKKKYGFVNGSYKKDHIADLDRRMIIGTGLGYQWQDSDKQAFSTDAGLAFKHENHQGKDSALVAYSTTEDALTVQASYKFKHNFTKKIGLLHDTFFYPSIDNFNDYYLTSSLELLNKFDANLYGSFKVLLDYDKDTEAEIASTDTKYLLSLGYSF